MSLLLTKLNQLLDQHGKHKEDAPSGWRGSYLPCCEGDCHEVGDVGSFWNISVGVFSGDCDEYICGDGGSTPSESASIDEAREACEDPKASGFVLDIYDDGPCECKTDSFWIHKRTLNGGE